MLWNSKERLFTISRANDAMIIFSTPYRGDSKHCPLVPDQLNSFDYKGYNIEYADGIFMQFGSGVGKFHFIE